MLTQRNKYTKEWDNESLAEHCLVHNSTDDQKRFLGRIDFQSPSRQLIQKEHSAVAGSESIQEDAITCANVLNLLCIAQRMSSPRGISRSNCCAGLRVYAAMSCHFDGKTYETIAGELGGRKRQIPERYISRFLEWSNENCADLIECITPGRIISHCRRFVSPGQSLDDILDELRISLVELMHELKSGALGKGMEGIEIYSDILTLQALSNSPVDILEVLKS